MLKRPSYKAAATTSHEEPLNWLIPATALVYLLTATLYLPGFTTLKTTQSIVSKAKIAAEADLQHLESLILRTGRAAASTAPQTNQNRKLHD